MKYFKGKEEVFRRVRIKTIWPDGKDSVQKFVAPARQGYVAETVAQMVEDATKAAKKEHPLHDVRLVCLGRAHFNIVVSEPRFDA